MTRSLLCLSLALLLVSCAHNQHRPAAPAAPRIPLSERAAASFHYLLYEQHVREGQFEPAVENLQAAIAILPRPQLYVELASLHWQMDEPENARTVLREAIAQYPDELQLYRTLATSYLAESRYKEASEALRSFWLTHPQSTQVARELAALALRAQDYAAAKDVLQKIPLEQYDAETYILLAQATSGIGQREKAISLLTKALELDPASVDALVEMAYLYELENNYPSAESTYQRILEMGESSPDVWVRMIRLNIKLNNPDRALELAMSGPDSTEYLLEAGYAFLQEHFYSHALTLFRMVEEREESPPAVLFFYLSLIAFEGDQDMEKALAYLRSIPAEDPLYKQALSFQGHILLQMKRAKKAAEIADAGKAKFPDDPAFWILHVAILEDQKDYPAARDKVTDALERFPQNKEMLYRRGIILEQMSLRDEAMESMEQLIAIDPGHTDALNYIGYTLAEEGRDLDRALLLVRAAAQNEPDNGYIVDSLAWVHFKRGEIDLAWKEIRRAVQLVDSDPIIWEHFGDIAAKVGEKSKAKAAYEKALSLEPKDPQLIRQKLGAL
jgi:tetratricopeptide (TPR) repeat protein